MESCKRGQEDPPTDVSPRYKSYVMYLGGYATDGYSLAAWMLSYRPMDCAFHLACP